MSAPVREPGALKTASRANYLWPLISLEEIEDGTPLILTEGDGVRVRTVDGDEYIDLMSTTSRASTLGYSQERIARAVYEQLDRLHYGGTAGTQADVTIELAARLAELAPGDLNTSVFVGSGSEANEVAFKMARLYHQRRGTKPRAYKIISRALEYHGAVGGATGASDWLGVRLPAEPGVPGFSRVPAPTCYRSPFPVEGEELGPAVRRPARAGDRPGGSRARGRLHPRAGDAGQRRADPATRLPPARARDLLRSTTCC